MDQAAGPSTIVPLLTAQHRHITALLDAVVDATGDRPAGVPAASAVPCAA